MTSSGPGRWPSIGRRVLAFVLTAGVLFLSSWIFINAPTRTLLPLGVGAPEVSHWLMLGALVAAALGVPDARTHVASRWVFGAAVLALTMAATPFIRFAATSRRFDATMAAALGDNALDKVSADVRSSMRLHPLAIGELFGHVDVGDALVQRDIAVGAPAGVPLTVDVYRPRSRGSYPIVVQIYGGAWQRGRPGDNPHFARWLAARGYVVFGVDYRHAPAFHWPAQIDDVRLCLAWIREHAEEFDADTSRVAFIGRSAGAHLALIAAYSNGPLPARAVVSFYGPVDLTESYAHPPHPDPIRTRPVEEALIGGTPAEKPEAFREASPITYVRRTLPPTLLIIGDRDHIVEPKYGARLRERLAATGTTVALLDIPWADHAFDEVFNGPSSQLALYHTERFLAWAMASTAAPITPIARDR